MGYSKVELANQALDLIGKDRILSLTEDSTAARKINEVFDRTCHSALARSHWTFQRTAQTMTGLTNDWEERWAYKYDLPNNCATFVRIIPRVDIPNHEPQVSHQLRGGAIYCNEPDAKGEFVFKSTDTLIWPNPFLDAVAFLLARNVVMPLTRKRSMWDEMNREYEAQLGLAIEHDAGQEPIFYPQEGGGYIDDRGGHTGWVEGAAPDGSIYWT